MNFYPLKRDKVLYWAFVKAARGDCLQYPTLDTQTQLVKVIRLPFRE
jgi:hypothetical protein